MSSGSQAFPKFVCCSKFIQMRFYVGLEQYDVLLGYELS